jgi:hypothetical protein
VHAQWTADLLQFAACKQFRTNCSLRVEMWSQTANSNFLWPNIWNDNYDRRSLKTEQVGETVEVQDHGLTNLWHTERSPLHAALNAVPISFYFFCPTSVSILRTTCVCMTAYRLYMNYRYCQIIWYGEWNIITQIGSGAKIWLDAYHWGAGLAVNKRIRHTGQNVL